MHYRCKGMLTDRRTRVQGKSARRVGEERRGKLIYIVTRSVAATDVKKAARCREPIPASRAAKSSSGITDRSHAHRGLGFGISVRPKSELALQYITRVQPDPILPHP
jgi:hypothetical protein